MKELEDYYMILQVHHLAEPEVIEGAYKKLAKKYHPDINKSKNSDDKMKRINRAYEELNDPAKRRAYDLRRTCEHAPHPAERAYKEPAYKKPPVEYGAPPIGAQAALDGYFRNIMNNRFDCSYALTSSIDKKNITCDDFISWQRAVASIFHLKHYSYKVHRAYKNRLLNRHMFEEAVEFSVNVVEFNVVMNREERDSILKTVVLEHGKWHVFIGYEKLQPIIGRFKELTDLLSAKSVMHELTQIYSKVDHLTGLLNRNGITEKIESEKDRFNRYKHAFSLMMIRIDIKKTNVHDIRQEANELAVKSVGEILLANLRKTDAIGRWDDMVFLVLLPETAEKGAIKAANKLLGKLKNNTLLYHGKSLATTVKIGAVEYRASLKEALDRLSRQMA